MKYSALTETTYLILAALGEPRHGYGVMQLVKTASQGRVVLGPGTLYGALTKLLDQGWIERAGESEAGGERRKLYVLTEKGREAVAQETARLCGLSEIGKSLMAAGA
jgi:DNA-binding PadR family transcriptional regulator